MSIKNKNSDKNTKHYFKKTSLLGHIGLAAMSMAAVISLIEMYHARAIKHDATVKPLHGQVTHASEAIKSIGHSASERKEEIRHAAVSYGSSMRSHPTAGMP